MGFLISINGADFEPYDFPAKGVHDSIYSHAHRIRRSEAGRQVNDLDLPKDFSQALKTIQLTNYQKAAEPRPRNRQNKIHRARSLMSAPPLFVDESTSCIVAKNLMEEKMIHHLLIGSPNSPPLGIVSDRDCLRALKEDPELRLSVENIMSRNLIAATPDSLIFEVAWAMNSHRVHCLPILDDKNMAIGIVTTTDIVRGLLSRADFELWA